MRQKQVALKTLRKAEVPYQYLIPGDVQTTGDALHAIQVQAESTKTSAARTALDPMRKLHQHGYLDRLRLINSTQAEFQAALNRIQPQASRVSVMAALTQVLGRGGRRARHSEIESNNFNNVALHHHE